MQSSITQLKQTDVNNIVGGFKEEITNKQAICGIVGTIVGISVVYLAQHYFLDPLFNNLRGKKDE